jgi:hypothetical protein
MLKNGFYRNLYDGQSFAKFRNSFNIRLNDNQIFTIIGSSLLFILVILPHLEYVAQSTFIESPSFIDVVVGNKCIHIPEYEIRSVLNPLEPYYLMKSFIDDINIVVNSSSNIMVIPLKYCGIHPTTRYNLIIGSVFNITTMLVGVLYTVYYIAISALIIYLN